jgi:hypothetical protein
MDKYCRAVYLPRFTYAHLHPLLSISFSLSLFLSFSLSLFLSFSLSLFISFSLYLFISFSLYLFLSFSRSLFLFLTSCTESLPVLTEGLNDTFADWSWATHNFQDYTYSHTGLFSMSFEPCMLSPPVLPSPMFYLLFVSLVFRSLPALWRVFVCA